MFKIFARKNSRLQTAVSSALQQDGRLTPDRIRVQAHDGVVTLSGSVPRYSEKIAAETTALSIDGVHAVVDALNVKHDARSRDEEIAHAALAALKDCYQAPAEIRISVDRSWVTLTGEADWDYQRTAVQNTITPLAGVRGITNVMTVRSGAEYPDTQTCIEEALKRCSASEGQDVKVTVDGTRVILTGRVDSEQEIREAGIAAWCAPGVMTVTNLVKLKIPA